MADITEVAAKSAKAQSNVSVRNLTDSDDITFADLEELDVALEREELVVTLNNTKTGKEFNLLFRYPTPAEIGMIEGSLLSPRVLKQLAQEIKEDSQTKDIKDETMQRAALDMVDNVFEKMVKTLAVCSLKPAGITEERIRKWDGKWIDGIYTELMKEVRKPTTVDTFHQVDSNAGKRATGTDTAKNGRKKS